MAAPRNAAPTPNIAPFIAVGALVLGVAATMLRLPGALVAWAVLIVAAWMSTPPQLTGKKDAAGYPTVGNPGEGRKMRGHQKWAALRWRLVGSTDWLLNDPAVLASSMKQAGSAAGRARAFTTWLLLPQDLIAWLAVGAAAIVCTLPVDQLAIIGAAPESSAWLMWPNAIAMYVIVRQMDASTRRYAAPYDPQPAIDIRSLIAAGKAKGMPPFMLPMVGVVSVVAGFAAATVALNGFDIAWLIFPWQVAAAGAGVALAAVVLRQIALPNALEGWQRTVDAREAWDTRWQTLKVDPAPYLTAHRELAGGNQLPVLVDTFDAPPNLGAEGVINLLPKMAPAIGGGSSVLALNEPDLDSQGQPVPGSKSPVKVTIAVWPTETTLDVLDPAVEQDAFELMLRAAASRELTAKTHLPQPMLTGIEKITVDGDGSPAAWRTSWVCSDDPGSTLGWGAGQISVMLGVEAIPDAAAGLIYVGALTDGRAEFSDPEIETRLVQLDRESAWGQRWHNVLKQGEQKPYIQHSVYAERNLGSSEVLFSQPFMTPQGIMNELYMNEVKEKSLSSALDNAPFVSVQRWDGASERSGERHHGAFRVVWSPHAITTTPARVIPSPGRGRDATMWVLAAAVMAGFDAAKLPRPEVVSATVLTARDSRQHIWDIQLRLYGAATLAVVKQQVDKIRNGMGGVEWLRVTVAQDGCRIVAGAKPSDVQFGRREHKDLCTALDWEQAFTDAKVITASGQVPKMLSAEPLSKNPKVQQLVFRMPPGLDRPTIRNAKKTLMPATGNIYLEDEAGPTPDTVTLIACPEQPVPFPAPFDWDEVASSTAIPFASGVTGEPIIYDWKLDPHLIVLGGTGSGKAQPMDALIPVPVSDRFPSGWAANQDLTRGDLVFGQRGEVNRILGFSDVKTEDVYVLTLDDGQEVRTSGHYLWRVWDAAARKAQVGHVAESRTIARETRLANAVRLDAVAEAIPSGHGATAPVIAEIAGIGHSGLIDSGVLTDAISRKALIATGKKAGVFAADDILVYLRRTIDRTGKLCFAGTALSHNALEELHLDGQWLSTRSLADALLGRPASRDERGLAKQIVRRSAARERDGVERRLTSVYPADEVIRLLARRERALALRHSEPTETVILTEDMLTAGLLTERGAARFAVEMPNAIAGPQATLPVAPYSLGAWLGDGSAHSIGITSADPQIIAEIEGEGYTFHRVDASGRQGAARTYYSRELVAAIRALFSSTHKRKADKRIPALYLRASSEQRLAVLQGLMDTDGTISSGGACELTLCKADLAADALELIRSLGIKASMTVGDTTLTENGIRRTTGKRHRIHFTTSQPVFRLERKATRLPARCVPPRHAFTSRTSGSSTLFRSGA